MCIARNKIATKTLVEKANKQNMIPNNSNFWKNNTRTNIVGIFYSYNSYIINICYCKNKLNEFKLGLKSFPSNIRVKLIAKFDKTSIQIYLPSNTVHSE